MPTFDFDLPQEDYERLRELGEELGVSPSQALHFYLQSLDVPDAEIGPATSKLRGLPTANSREELIAMLEQAMDSGPGRPAAQVVKELRERNQARAKR